MTSAIGATTIRDLRLVGEALGLDGGEYVYGDRVAGAHQPAPLAQDLVHAGDGDGDHGQAQLAGE